MLFIEVMQAIRVMVGGAKPAWRRVRSRQLQLSVASTCLLAAAIGCTSHRVTELRTAADASAGIRGSQAETPAFDYLRGEVPFENHLVGPGSIPEYTVRELTIPSIGDNGQDGNLIRGRYYRSELGGGPRPVVIILPIFARYTYPSARMSTYIQRHSRGAVHVLDVQGENFLFDWERAHTETDVERFLDLFREGVERERTVIKDIRRLVDWAEQQAEVDGSRVALMGFSRSAILASAAATQEPRLAATVLIMGGVHSHEIVARCDGKRTNAVQKHVAEAFGWSPAELEERLRPVFHEVDAASYPGRVDPASVLIFEAGRDRCIGERPRHDLWVAMGRPLKYTLNYGHRIAFFSMTPLGGGWMCRRTLEFLAERLLADPQKSSPSMNDNR